MGIRCYYCLYFWTVAVDGVGGEIWAKGEFGSAASYCLDERSEKGILGEDNGSSFPLYECDGAEQDGRF